MSRNDKIAVFILGAAAAVAIIRYLKMPGEEKEALHHRIMDKTNELLEDAEETVDKVNNFLDDYNNPSDNSVLNKLLLVRKIIGKLY